MRSARALPSALRQLGAGAESATAGVAIEDEITKPSSAPDLNITRGRYVAPRATSPAPAHRAAQSSFHVKNVQVRRVASPRRTTDLGRFEGVGARYPATQLSPRPSSASSAALGACPLSRRTDAVRAAISRL